MRVRALSLRSSQAATPPADGGVGWAPRRGVGTKAWGGTGTPSCIPSAPRRRPGQRLLHQTQGCHSCPGPTSDAHFHISFINRGFGSVGTAAAQEAKETQVAPGHAGKSKRGFACSVARYRYSSRGCRNASDILTCPKKVADESQP